MAAARGEEGNPRARGCGFIGAREGAGLDVRELTAQRCGLVRLASGPGEVKTVPVWEFYQEEGGCEVVSGPGTRTSGLDDDAHGTGARRLESR